MQRKTLISSLALGAGLLAGVLALAPAVAQTSAAPSLAAEAELSTAQVQSWLAAAGYGAIDKLERKRSDRLYEVKTTDRDGRRVELYLDSRSGEIVKSEVKRDKPAMGDMVDKRDKGGSGSDLRHSDSRRPVAP